MRAGPSKPEHPAAADPATAKPPFASASLCLPLSHTHRQQMEPCPGARRMAVFKCKASRGSMPGAGRGEPSGLTWRAPAEGLPPRAVCQWHLVGDCTRPVQLSPQALRWLPPPEGPPAGPRGGGGCVEERVCSQGGWQEGRGQSLPRFRQTGARAQRALSSPGGRGRPVGVCDSRSLAEEGVKLRSTAEGTTRGVERVEPSR